MPLEIEWICRILCAMIAGTVIGQERQHKSKEAGARTHAIVAVSACLLMIVSKYGFADTDKFDAARVAAQVVSGISFLGAGLIFVRNDFIQGLTTAAGIWAVAAIGLCFGTGMYTIGFVVTILLYFIQGAYQMLFSQKHPPRSRFHLRMFLKPETHVSDIAALLQEAGYIGDEYRINMWDDGWILETQIHTFQDVNPGQLLNTLKQDSHIVEVELY